MTNAFSPAVKIANSIFFYSNHVVSHQSPRWTPHSFQHTSTHLITQHKPLRVLQTQFLIWCYMENMRGFDNNARVCRCVQIHTHYNHPPTCVCVRRGAFAKRMVNIFRRGCGVRPALALDRCHALTRNKHTKCMQNIKYNFESK